MVSIKVSLTYVLYLLTLISGLNAIWTGGYFLIFLEILSVGFGAAGSAILAGFLIIIWLGWFQVKFVVRANRLHDRMLKCALTGSADGLKSFFNHEDIFDDASLVVGAVLSGWWALSIAVWCPSFIPDISNSAGELGVFLLVMAIVPVPSFLRSRSKNTKDKECAE